MTKTTGVVTGPSVTMADLIDQGWLTPVKYIAPAVADDVPLTMTSGIGHTIVNPYLQYAHGKRAIVFCSSVEHCEHVVGAFINAGVTAATVLASQNNAEREANIERFQQGSLMVLATCNVLLESNLPEAEVVIVATPTASRSRYHRFVASAVVPVPEPRREGESRPEYETRMANRTRDQRLMDIARSKKPFALILDVAGNVLRLGMPDAQQKPAPAPADLIPIRTLKLTGPALRYAVACAEGLRDQLSWCLTKDGTGIQNMWTDDHGCWDPLDWEIGGPLLTKYAIAFEGKPGGADGNGTWMAYLGEGPDVWEAYGDEHLLAACRAVVLRHLGAIVQIPADIAAASDVESSR